MTKDTINIKRAAPLHRHVMLSHQTFIVTRSLYGFRWSSFQSVVCGGFMCGYGRREKHLLRHRPNIQQWWNSTVKDEYNCRLFGRSKICFWVNLYIVHIQRTYYFAHSSLCSWALHPKYSEDVRNTCSCIGDMKRRECRACAKKSFLYHTLQSAFMPPAWACVSRVARSKV